MLSAVNILYSFIFIENMEEAQETDISILVSDVNNIAIEESEVNKSISENKPLPSSSEQSNSYENLFDQLKGHNKHIFVLSTAGKPIYTR
jgi:hypothetical protein